MTTIYCDPDNTRLSASTDDRVVRLYGPATMGISSVGNPVRRSLKRLDLEISGRAFDFLSIALGVIAADEFVSRADGGDGFGRDLDLTVAIAEPNFWEGLSPDLVRILNFLTGDTWSLKFVGGGHTPPKTNERNRMRQRINISKANMVCLFSGGLDSLIGAVTAIHNPNYEPLLVSRATTGDRTYQQTLLSKLSNPLNFNTNDAPRKALGSSWVKEGTTRSRSLLFIALAVCCASALSNANNVSSTPIWIPENGVIALNAPLTPRRIGASSTRTAHPQYISGVSDLLVKADIKATLENPFIFQTKGEMIQNSPHRNIIDPLVEETVSCGKYKRTNQQCGICVPCLIRRAANNHAGIIEPSNLYRYEDLSLKLGSSGPEADLYAVRYALATLSQKDIPAWVLKTGEIPPAYANRHYDVAWKGLKELKSLLQHWNVPI